MGYTAVERETTIQWSDADDGTATIVTYQRRVMRKLRQHPRARLIEQLDGGEIWEIPAKCVNFRKRGTRGGRKMPPQAVETLKLLQLKKRLHQRGDSMVGSRPK